MYKEYASKQFVEEYFKNQNISSVSTPDWNENDESSSSYIKNRPFYNKTQYAKKYEGDITFTDSRTVSDLDLWINEGNFYRIEFNGGAFEAVGVELGFFHNKVGDVNNNPIEIECYEVIAEGSGRYCWIKLSDNYELGTYSLVVYEGIPDVKKIEQQYLPENIVYFSDDEENGADVPNEDNALLAEIEALKAQMPLMVTLTNKVTSVEYEECDLVCDSTHTHAEIKAAFDSGRQIIIKHVCQYATGNDGPHIAYTSNVYMDLNDYDYLQDCIRYDCPGCHGDNCYIAIDKDTGEDVYSGGTGNG